MKIRTMVGICLVLVMALASGVYSYGAVDYVQEGNALEWKNIVDIPLANNASALTKEKPAQYASSKDFLIDQFETHVNKIYPSKKRGAGVVGYRFQTAMMLPLRWFNETGADFKNTQSLAYDGTKYMYVVVSEGIGTNVGRIVRYDYQELKKAKLDKKGRVSILRKASVINILTHPTKMQKTWKSYKKYLKYIKVGPLIPIGHGGTLSYNPAKDELWMLRDDENSSGDYILPSGTTIIQRIDRETLDLMESIRFETASLTGVPINMGRVLTFDNAGFAYTAVKDTTKAGRLEIRRITITDDRKVWVTRMQRIEKGPSMKSVQNMSYNPTNNRIYLVSNDSVLSFPLAKLGALSGGDFQYINYASKREWESMVFDKEGYAYALLVRGPEILKSINK